MFRENVLIALTILVTILALSFVILMTVYLQLHELENKVGALEKLSKQDEQTGVTVHVMERYDGSDDGKRHQELIRRAQAFWNEMDRKEKNGPVSDSDPRSTNEAQFQPYILGSIVFDGQTTEKSKSDTGSRDNFFLKLVSSPGRPDAFEVNPDFYLQLQKLDEINRFINNGGGFGGNPWFDNSEEKNSPKQETPVDNE